MKKLLILLSIPFIFSCTSEAPADVVIANRQGKPIPKRKEIVMASLDTLGTFAEYLQGLEIIEYPRPRKKANWITFPNTFTGEQYFFATMVDENFALDPCRAIYPTNGTNGYYIACPLEEDVQYYLWFFQEGNGDVFVPISI